MGKTLVEMDREIGAADERLTEAVLQTLRLLCDKCGAKGLGRKEAETYISHVYSGYVFEDWWNLFGEELPGDEDGNRVWAEGCCDTTAEH